MGYARSLDARAVAPHAFVREGCSTCVVKSLSATPGHSAARLHGLDEAWPSHVQDAPRSECRACIEFSVPSGTSLSSRPVVLAIVFDVWLLAGWTPERVPVVELVKIAAAPRRIGCRSRSVAPTEMVVQVKQT